MAIELKSTRPMNVTSIDLLPEPLKNVRALATKLLASMLANMFDNTDDVLFDLADKAGNNLDQTIYFDSMREVRIKRQAMEAIFNRAIADNFKVFQRSVKATAADSFTDVEEGALSLIQDDELEESVAIRGMVSKVHNQLGEALQQLTQRMNFLAKQATIDEDNNPVGPAKLGEAFQQACQELALDIRSKLVIYKLFEKFVLAELGELYQGANQSLVASGVLPQLVETKKQRKSHPSVTGAQQGSSSSQSGDIISEASTEDQNEIFSLLRGLLANRQPVNQGGPVYLPVADSGPVLSQSELVNMLSTVQQERQSENDQLQPVAVDVRRVLHTMADSQGGAVPHSVGRVDDDAINLVSMLFEYILDDHTLSVPMKALLARLQIPMLKVALLDKSFFSKGAHPARKLLNELASAALRWNEPADVSRDNLFCKINEVVDIVLNEFESDVGIFEKLLEEFSAFISKEQHRSELIEQRTRDAEEGLGRTQRARADVATLINERAAGKALPSVVVELLREGWSNYLFLLYVKEGMESEAWTGAVQVVDDLIWSVDSDYRFEHRRELLGMIPSLLQRLREGLNTVSFSKNRMRELFGELETVHMNCLKAPDKEPQEQSQSLGQVADPVSPVSADLPVDAPVEAQPSADIIVDVPEVESLDSVNEAEEERDHYVDMVDSMVVGAWVECLDDNEEKSRCKLAAIIRASGKYIFVNRVGIKIAEHSRSSLIEAARQGRISMLDNALLFDRALESVIGCLREMKD